MPASTSSSYFAAPSTHTHQPWMFNQTHLRNPSLKIIKFSQSPIKIPHLKQICKQGSLREAFRWLTAFFNGHAKWPLVNNDEVYATLLELCASKKAHLQGQQVHAHIVKNNGGPNSAFLSTKLAFMYGKCGSTSEAEELFDEMRERTIFSWNSMMGAYASNGEPLRALEMYREMRVSGIPPDSCTFPCALKACASVQDLRCGAEIHGLAIKCGYDSVIFVVNSLVALYAKCNDLDGARKLFDRMNERSDVVSWNSVVSAYVVNGQCVEALGLFREMQQAGVAANTYTFVAVLQACKDSAFRKLGMEIHAAILRSSQYLDVYVANALVTMYVNFGKMREASEIFNKLDEKDHVTWNAMLTGFLQNGLYKETLQFFCDMQDSGLNPDQVSVIGIIAASGRLGNLLNGKEIHAYAIKNGLGLILQVGNSLVDMYAKFCCLSYAGRAFTMMPDKDFISWTTIIAGYAQNGFLVEALELSRQVQMKGMDVDAMMIGSILLACSGLNCMPLIKEVHGYTIRQGLSDRMLQNTIVDVYGECGNIDYAAKVFESIECKDVVSWTSMLSSYAHNGLSNEALEVFRSMKQKGVEPDSITVRSALSAAASLSTLNKGKEIHGFIVRKCLVLEGSVSNSLVDMYARCGSLENAYRVFTSKRNGNLLLWTTMIHASGMHGLGKAAIDLFCEMENQNLAPDHITFLALLYACSHAGLAHEGKKFLQIMKRKYQLVPWPEHYACLVDLLGRANQLEEAYRFARSIPIKPTAEVWCALLGACQIHSNKKIGEIAVQRLLELEPGNPGNYVLVSNIFAANGRWRDVEEVRLKMKGSGLKKNRGCSWIEVGNRVHTFVARDSSHPESYKIYQKLGQIIDKLKREGGYAPQTKYVLHNVKEEEKVQMLYGHSERLAIAYGLLTTPEGTPIRITKNIRICGDCHTFCGLVSKLLERKLIVRDASRFHHFEGGACSCGDFW